MKYLKTYQIFESFNYNSHIFKALDDIYDINDMNNIMDNSYDLTDQGLSVYLEPLTYHVDGAVKYYDDKFGIVITSGRSFNLDDVVIKEGLERLIRTIKGIKSTLNPRGFDIYRFRYFRNSGNLNELEKGLSSVDDFSTRLDSIKPELKRVDSINLFFHKKPLYESISYDIKVNKVLTKDDVNLVSDLFLPYMDKYNMDKIDNYYNEYSNPDENRYYYDIDHVGVNSGNSLGGREIVLSILCKVDGNINDLEDDLNDNLKIELNNHGYNVSIRNSIQDSRYIAELRITKDLD